LLRPNSLTTSRRNISEHYDLGNDFYKLFLDPTMTYSSALFEDGRAELPLCPAAAAPPYLGRGANRQIRPPLPPVEIKSPANTSWKSAAAGADSVCTRRKITASASPPSPFPRSNLNTPANFFKRKISGRVEIKLMDYRLLTGQFDKIVSIEMLEAVGDAYLETYFAKCHALLKPNGLLALQMITCPDSRTIRCAKMWIGFRSIFSRLAAAVHSPRQRGPARDRRFVLHDLKDLGLSYAET
jgi:cyclopropane-fatty-acyl-phospholipid synthase